MKYVTKQTTGACVAATVLAIAAPALAQDSAPGLSFDGYVELEYVSSDTSDETFGHADLTFGVGPGVISGLPSLGFDVALRAFANDSDTEFAPYASAALYTEFGKFSAGAPRPVAADMIDLPSIGGVRALDIQFGPFLGSGVEFAYLLGGLDTPLGLRYDHRVGALSVGASYHRFDDSSNEADTYSLAARYDFEPFEVFASYERVDTSGGGGDAYMIGVEAEYGQLSGGAALFDSDIFFDADGGQVWATYSPIENLSLTANYIGVESSDFWGLNAEYEFAQGAYLQAGAADLDGSEVFDISFGWRF